MLATLRPFQIFILAVFVGLGLLSLVLLSNYSPAGSDAATAYGDRVVMWGTLPYQKVAVVLDLIEDQDKAFEVVEYVNVLPEEFGARLVNAIAEGRSPDLILLPHTELVTHRSKLLPIPYSTEGFSQRDILNTYLDGVDVFVRPDGLYAIPVVVDPLVQFWNRDLFASAGLASAPQSWEELVGTIASKLTVRDATRTIQQSAVAFGEFRNVAHATEILSMLTLQSGSQMVTEDDTGYEVALNETRVEGGRPPLEAALQFFTDFSNASNPLYSWNRAQPADQLAFIAGDLALYYGYGSETPLIAERNPNLNFDISLPPQGANASISRTYGTFYGLAIPRGSRNSQGAFAAANTLASAQYTGLLAQSLNMAPVHRSAHSRGGNNAFESVIYDAALFARGWLSPNTASTDAAMQIMIEDVVSNRARVSKAVNDAINRLILAY